MAAPTNAAKCEKSSCQPGAVHTWHFSDVLRPSSDVRCWGLNRPKSAVAGRGRVLKPVPVADLLSSECDGHRWHSISLQRRPPTNCLSMSCCSPGRSSLSRNDVPVATDQPKDHSLALVARFRVTTAVPPPVAGVGFLYVSTSPLIAMKRF
jgi:hypothetical protein